VPPVPQPQVVPAAGQPAAVPAAQPTAVPQPTKNVHLPLERRPAAAARPAEQVTDLEAWSELPDIA
jgi:hypothetical protein